MRIEKEEENSCFRSTDTAQCAEKGKFSSSFSMMKIHFATEMVFGATAPYYPFLAVAIQILQKKDGVIFKFLLTMTL